MEVNISLCLIACIHMATKLVLPQKRLNNYHLISDYRKINQAKVEIQQESNMALRQAQHSFHLSPKLYITGF